MRKILVSLLVVSMVLGLVGTAFAGYSDAAANKSIDKVSAFGWMNGYPDGTFKPAGNITRAEAAAVIVRALGLSAAADAAKGLGTKFADVTNSHWASGYINVCTTKGILKGYPDGTFKPEANVSNAEVVTMIVRALNRESQAVGEWPIGHITVAAAENIIGSGFVSSALATRENVATYVAKASDVVFLKLTTNGWEEDTKTMAKQNDLTMLEDYKVDVTDAEQKTMTMTGGTPVTTKSYELATGFAVGEGKSLRDIEGFIVDAYINDDNDVVFVQIVTASTSKTGVIKSLGGSGAAASPYFFYVDGDSKRYELSVAPVAKVYRNGEEIAIGMFPTTFLVDDTVNFSMEGNYVSVAKAVRNDHPDAVVEAVRATGDIAAQYVRYDRRGVVYTKYMSVETTITLDGKTAALAEIKEDMVVNIQLDPNDNTRVMGIAASTKKVTGKVTAKRHYTDPIGDNYWYVSIDGVEYRVGGSARVFDAGFVGATPNWGTDVLYAAITVGDTITAYLAPNGRINQADIATATASYGKVTAVTLGGDYDKWTVDVKGTAVVYEIDDDNPPVIAATVKPGDYISMKRNSSGRLIGGAGGTNFAIGLVAPVAAPVGTAFVPGDLVTDVLSGDKLIEVNNATWLTIGDSSVVYVDGEYGTAGSISKDSRIRYAASGAKITFAIVDTIAKVDSGLIGGLTGKVIQGIADSVEDRATVEFYPTAADAEAMTAVITPAAVSKGAFIALPAPASTTLVQTTADGEFNVTLPAAYANAKVFIRITDPAGNHTVLGVTVAP